MIEKAVFFVQFAIVAFMGLVCAVFVGIMFYDTFINNKDNE